MDNHRFKRSGWSSMNQFYLPIVCAALCACASTIHSDGKTVLIEHGTAEPKAAVSLAQKECEALGKTVEFEDMRCPGRCISKFRCVEK